MSNDEVDDQSDHGGHVTPRWRHRRHVAFGGVAVAQGPLLVAERGVDTAEFVVRVSVVTATTHVRSICRQAAHVVFTWNMSSRIDMQTHVRHSPTYQL